MGVVPTPLVLKGVELVSRENVPGGAAADATPTVARDTGMDFVVKLWFCPVCGYIELFDREM